MGSSWCSETKCCHLSLFLLGRLLEMLGVCSGVLCVGITFEDVFDTHSTLFRSTNVGLFSIHSKSGPGEFLSFPLNEPSVILISDTHSCYRHNDCITGQFSLLWLTLRHDWETVTRGLWRCRYNGRKAMIMEKIISAAQSFHLQLNGVTFLAADGSRSCERPWAVCLQVHATLAVRMRLPRKTKKISRPSSESLALFVYFSSYFATTPATSLLLPLTSKESIVIFDLFFFSVYYFFCFTLGLDPRQQQVEGFSNKISCSLLRLFLVIGLGPAVWPDQRMGPTTRTTNVNSWRIWSS